MRSFGQDSERRVDMDMDIGRAGGRRRDGIQIHKIHTDI